MLLTIVIISIAYMIVFAVPSMVTAVDSANEQEYVNLSLYNENVSEEQVMQRINELKELAGEHFTTCYDSCKTNKIYMLDNGYYYHASCDACRIDTIVRSDWIINNTKFTDKESVAIDALNTFKNSRSWTCCAFANFAHWYIFRTTSRSLIKSGMRNEETLSYAKPGDYLVKNGGSHYEIFVSCDSTGCWVIDGNGGKACSKDKAKVDPNLIQYRHINYNGDSIKIYRATNYNTENREIKGYYYIVNDSEGHNVRSSASISASIVGVLPNGEKVLITKYNSNNQWGYVTYGGFSGWTNLSSTYMKFDSICYEECEHSYSSASYERTHPHKEYKKCSLCGDIQYTGNTKLVSGCTTCYPPDGYLYKSLDNDTSNPKFPGKWLRSSDSTSGTITGSVPYGEYAVVIEYNSDKTWAYVIYNGTEGWTKLYEGTFPYQGEYYCPVVTFNATGGSISTSSKKVYINTQYGTLPTPTRSGYTFNGWYTSSSGGTKITSDTNVTLESDQTLYAQWTADKKYVFDINGILDGVPTSNLGTYGTVDVYINGAIVGDNVNDFCSNYPAGTTYNIYDLSTANGKMSCVNPSIFSGTINADTVLTLEFKSLYNVIYNANGGTNAPSTQIKTYGEDLLLSTDSPVRDGYYFCGWMKSPNGETFDYRGGDTYNTNSDIILYAYWRPKHYKINYNANGGYLSLISEEKLHDKPMIICDRVEPTRTGYKFAGWSTSPSGKAEYLPYAEYTKNASVTFYAVWNPSFDSDNDGTTTQKDISAMIDIICGRKAFDKNNLEGIDMNNDGAITMYDLHQAMQIVKSILLES